MARSRRIDSTERNQRHRLIVEEYRSRLAEPARFPWEGLEWQPKIIGPTWSTVEGYWLLPERTLGWDVLAWSGLNYQHSPGVEWRYTLEQARFVLWWMALDEHGRFLFRDGVLQRLKGWGKDPVGACLSGVETFGPARFFEWADDGEPVAVDVPDAWVQTAAVSLEQTKNTMRLYPGLFTAQARAEYRLQIGKELIHGLDDSRLIQAVTSSPATLEGARSTFVLLNETHLWDSSNSGHDMADVIERNATKSKDGAARTLRITNAFVPGNDSVAERDRDAFEAEFAGTHVATGILYDSLEAPPDAPLSAEAAPGVVAAIRGDSDWLSSDRIVKSILDVRNSPSRSRRFWYNQVTAAEDSWVARFEWDRRADPTVNVSDGAQITLGFDGSKTDDHCGLVGWMVEADHGFVVDIWDPAKHGGEAPRQQIDGKVRQSFERWDVVAFYSDLHPFESYVDSWAEDLAVELAARATSKHPIAWDMRGRQKEFTFAAERLHDALLEGELTHDGDSRLAQHVYNARRRPNAHGVSFGKEHRESARKIDGLSAAVLARLARMDYLALPDAKKRRKKRSGRAAFL